MTAKTIAGALTNYNVTFFPVELHLPKRFAQKIATVDAYNKGDHSLLETDLDSLDVQGYDLVLIGMPTIGGKPPVIFNHIMEKLKNLKGNHIVLFGTSRIYRGEMLHEMRMKVEAKGGNVIEEKNFKSFFLLRKKQAAAFGAMINNAAINKSEK